MLLSNLNSNSIIFLQILSNKNCENLFWIYFINIKNFCFICHKYNAINVNSILSFDTIIRDNFQISFYYCNNKFMTSLFCNTVFFRSIWIYWNAICESGSNLIQTGSPSQSFLYIWNEVFALQIASDERLKTFVKKSKNFLICQK